MNARTKMWLPSSSSDPAAYDKPTTTPAGHALEEVNVAAVEKRLEVKNPPVLRELPPRNTPKKFSAVSLSSHAFLQFDSEPALL